MVTRAADRRSWVAGVRVRGTDGGTGVRRRHPSSTDRCDPDDEPTSRVSLNLLWVVIGAVLVIFMQAGFALVETGFCRAKHAAHVMSTNFAIFGLGFVGFFLIGFPLMFGGFSYPGYFGLDDAARLSRSIGIGDWVFLWKGGWALDRHRRPQRRAPRSRRSSSTWSPSWTRRPRSRPARWPSGGSGRRSSAGACSAARSTTRCSAPGPGAAAGSTSSATASSSASATSTSPAPVWCTRSVVSRRSPARSCSVPASASTAPTASRARSPAHNIPMAHARHVHPAVRLVRLQRRVDVRGDRRAVRRGRRSTPRIAAAFGATVGDVLRA